MTVLLNDGRYKVTSAYLATSRHLYPLVHSTVRLRRDPLWAGAAVATLTTATLIVYGDLLTHQERVGAAAIAAIALVMGWSVAILQLEAPGHGRGLFVDFCPRLRKVFGAICEARANDPDKLMRICETARENLP